MTRTIIGVNYRNKKTGEFDARTYNYYCTLPVVLGDVVSAPTATGASVAKVVELEVPESHIDERILPIMKTITEFAELEG